MAGLSLFRIEVQGPGPLHPAAQGPVPERLMLYGLLGSFPTVTAMLALSADPPPVGVKVTAIVQAELGDAEAPQVPPFTAKSPAFVPLMLSPIGSENFDRLVIVTFLVFDDILAVSVPYASVTGVTVAGIVSPVLSAIGGYDGLNGSGLSETDSVADSVPRAPGVKVTVITQAVFGASVGVQVTPVTLKSPPLGPPKVSLSVTGWV